jgi:hypothetical protein
MEMNRSFSWRPLSLRRFQIVIMVLGIQDVTVVACGSKVCQFGPYATNREMDKRKSRPSFV